MASLVRSRSAVAESSAPSELIVLVTSAPAPASGLHGFGLRVARARTRRSSHSGSPASRSAAAVGEHGVQRVEVVFLAEPAREDAIDVGERAGVSVLAPVVAAPVSDRPAVRIPACVSASAAVLKSPRVLEQRRRRQTCCSSFGLEFGGAREEVEQIGAVNVRVRADAVALARPAPDRTRRRARRQTSSRAVPGSPATVMRCAVVIARPIATRFGRAVFGGRASRRGI